MNGEAANGKNLSITTVFPARKHIVESVKACLPHFQLNYVDLIYTYWLYLNKPIEETV